MQPYASPFGPPADVPSVTALLPPQGRTEIIGSAPDAASMPRRRPLGSAMAAVAVVALVTAGLTYALVTTRQDLARTTRTLSGTRTDLTNTQDELTATRTKLTRTEKTLTAAKDQINTIESQLADARNDAEQEKSRGDQAVEAAADLRLCLNNVLVNANAMQSGDYADMTWSDAMYTQCQKAVTEGDAMADPPSTTTTTA
jgi:uncharacterized protein (DUF342 family)